MALIFNFYFISIFLFHYLLSFLYVFYLRHSEDGTDTAILFYRYPFSIILFLCLYLSDNLFIYSMFLLIFRDFWQFILSSPDNSNVTIIRY